MPVRSYETVEDRSSEYIASQSSTWQGYNGCTTGTNSIGACSSSAASSTTAYYDPTPEDRYWRSPNYSGRTHIGPKFRMTPLTIIHHTTRNYLLRTKSGANGFSRYFQYGKIDKPSGSCVRIELSRDVSGPKCATWTNVTHLGTGSTYTVNQFSQSQLDTARQRVEDAASLDTMTSYDILTDIAEAREIPRMLRSISGDIFNILRSFRGRHSLPDLRTASLLPPASLLKSPSKALRKIGDQWMQYRYGIMPLVYSYRDITKVVKRGYNVRSRKVETVRPEATGTSLPAVTVDYMMVQYEGEIQYAATCFSHFQWREASIVAGLGTNLFATAWELVPYSFVADWFVNMGNYITRVTNTSLSKDTWACISRRDKYSKRTYQHYKNRDKTVTFANALSSPWVGTSPAAESPLVIPNPEGYYLLSEDIVDDYNRQLFDPRDAHLQIDASLNWKRMLDAAVMILNQLGSLTRTLKGH